MSGTKVEETVVGSAMYEAVTWLGCTSFVVLAAVSVALFAGLDVVAVVLYFMIVSAFLVVLVGAGVQRARLEAAAAKKTPVAIEPVSVATARRLRRQQLLREEANRRRELVREQELELEESLTERTHRYVSAARAYTATRRHTNAPKTRLWSVTDDIELTNQTELTIEGTVRVPSRACNSKDFILQPGETKLFVNSCTPTEVVIVKPESVRFDIPDSSHHQNKPSKMTIRRHGNQFIATAPPGYYT